MEKAVVRTETAPAPFQGAPYSQAITANGFVFVSGQLGLKPAFLSRIPGQRHHLSEGIAAPITYR